jgi:UDP-2,3-diacylglucosamine hydrolase
MTTLFVSDLHLDAARPEITNQFLHFLEGRARKAEALYILGDLFEFWIGDDDPDPDKQRVVAALSTLTSSGVPCRFMHGNRDFLVGTKFAAQTGVEILADGTVVELAGRRVLLMHGDLLCTDDRSYQRLRRILRNPLVQWLFRRLSLERRERLADRIRQGSREHTTSAHATIMDVNDDAVRAAFAQHSVDTLIHGHTHRPGVHRYTVPGDTWTRIVLGDWHKQGSVLEWNATEYRLEALPRDEISR